MSAQPDSRCHPTPQNMMQLMGFRGHPAKHAEQNLQTTHRQPSFSSPRDARKIRATTVAGTCCRQDVPSFRVPCPEHRSPVAAAGRQPVTSGGRCPLGWPSLLRHWQFTITKRSSAGQQIFFLLRQQARQPQLRKVGQSGLETPYLAGVTLKATAGCAPPAPAARCPHPTSHRAWPVAPSLGVPSPSPLPHPHPHTQHRPPGPCRQSLYLSASSPFASLFMPYICSLFSLILSLSTSLTTSQ